MAYRDRYSGDRLQEAGLEERLEDLRQGTVNQFHSDFIRIPVGGEIVFPHGLDLVPMHVDVVTSEYPDGRAEIDGNSSATVVKDGTNVTVTNSGADDLFFQARAF